MSFILDYEAIKIFLISLLNNCGIELNAWSLSLQVNKNTEKLRTTWFLEIQQKEISLDEQIPLNLDFLLKEISEYLIQHEIMAEMFSLSIFIPELFFEKLEKHIVIQEKHVLYYEGIHKEMRGNIQFIKKT